MIAQLHFPLLPVFAKRSEWTDGQTHTVGYRDAETHLKTEFYTFWTKVLVLLDVGLGSIRTESVSVSVVLSDNAI